MRCGGSRGCLDLGQQWRVIVVRQRGHRRQRLVWLLGLRTVWHSVVVVLWLVVVHLWWDLELWASATAMLGCWRVWSEGAVRCARL